MNPQLHDPLVRRAIRTADGDFLATYSARGLAGLAFPHAGDGGSEVAAEDPAPTAWAARVPGWHALTVSAVAAVLAGRELPNLPPLDLAGGTPFQQGVWAVLRTIARGRTLSYGEVAAQIGRPQAARAVGSACGANPVPLLIPCHRVLGAAGALGGFSGGLDWKRLLLEREGIRPDTARSPAARGR